MNQEISAPFSSHDSAHAQYSAAPLGIGQLLDRAYQLLPSAAAGMLPIFAVVSLVSVVGVHFQNQSRPILSLCFMLLAIVLGVLAYLVSVFVAQAAWCGGDRSVRRALSQIKLASLGRAFVVSIWVAFVTLLGLLLFIIPGIVYAMNRCLVLYILFFEDAGARQAIKKSKFLMTRGRWYSLDAPLARMFALSVVLWIMVAFGSLLQFGSQFSMMLDVVSYVASLLLIWGTGVLSYCIQLFSYIAYVGFYYDLRSRYEGIDLAARFAALETATPRD